MEGAAVVRCGGAEHRVKIVVDGVIEIMPAPGNVVSSFESWFSVRAIGSVSAAVVKTVLPADSRILEA